MNDIFLKSTTNLAALVSRLICLLGYPPLLCTVAVQNIKQ